MVLTGGPCGGKSTALAQMRTHFEQKGFTVLCAPEAATLLFTAGASKRSPLPPTPPPSFTTGPSKRSPPPSPPPEATPLGWRGQPSMLSSWHVRTYAGPDPQWGPSFCLSTESDEDAGARYRTRDGHPGMIQLQCQPIEICKPPRVAERGPHASPCIAAPWARTRCPSPSAYRWRSRPTSAPWVLPTASPQSCCWTAVSWTRRHT